MQRLASNDIISIWETGTRRSHIEHALTILAHALPDTSRDELALIPLGERDRLLLQLRALTFGDAMQGYAECPSCSARLEFGLKVRDLLRDAPPAATERDVKIGEKRFSIRPLNSRDMAAAAELSGEQAREYMLLSCSNGAVSDIERGIEEHFAEHLAGLDPLAELLINLRCPDCGHDWQSIFDITSFFWTELSVQARRLLHDVAALARVYGWREADILAMSPTRRAFYLEVLR